MLGYMTLRDLYSRKAEYKGIEQGLDGSVRGYFDLYIYLAGKQLSVPPVTRYMALLTQAL